MATDFSALLKVPMNTAIRPKELPAGDYRGVINQYEFLDDNKNKTPYVRFHITPTQWPESVSDEDKGQRDPKGDFHPIELAKKRQRKDYFLTEDAKWRLVEFLTGFGFDPGKNFDETIPETKNREVVMEIQTVPNQDGTGFFNRVGNCVAVT